VIHSINLTRLGMSPRTMKRAHGGTAQREGSKLQPHHATHVRGVSVDVPAVEMTPPEHVIQIEDHETSKEGLAERALSKLGVSSPTVELKREGEALHHLDEDLVKYVAHPGLLGEHELGTDKTETSNAEEDERSDNEEDDSENQGEEKEEQISARESERERRQ